MARQSKKINWRKNFVFLLVMVTFMNGVFSMKRKRNEVSEIPYPSMYSTNDGFQCKMSIHSKPRFFSYHTDVDGCAQRALENIEKFIDKTHEHADVLERVQALYENIKKIYASRHPTDASKKYSNVPKSTAEAQSTSKSQNSNDVELNIGDAVYFKGQEDIIYYCKEISKNSIALENNLFEGDARTISKNSDEYGRLLKLEIKNVSNPEKKQFQITQESLSEKPIEKEYMEAGTRVWVRENSSQPWSGATVVLFYGNILFQSDDSSAPPKDFDQVIPENGPYHVRIQMGDKWYSGVVIARDENQEPTTIYYYANEKVLIAEYKKWNSIKIQKTPYPCMVKYKCSEKHKCSEKQGYQCSIRFKVFNQLENEKNYRTGKKLLSTEVEIIKNKPSNPHKCAITAIKQLKCFATNYRGFANTDEEEQIKTQYTKFLQKIEFFKKIYDGEEVDVTYPEEVNNDQENEVFYEVDSILEDRYNNEKQETEYLVKWSGSGKPTWEPTENLQGNKSFELYLEQNKDDNYKIPSKTKKVLVPISNTVSKKSDTLGSVGVVDENPEFHADKNEKNDNLYKVNMKVFAKYQEDDLNIFYPAKITKILNHGQQFEIMWDDKYKHDRIKTQTELILQPQQETASSTTKEKNFEKDQTFKVIKPMKIDDLEIEVGRVLYYRHRSKTRPNTLVFCSDTAHDGSERIYINSELVAECLIKINQYFSVFMDGYELKPWGLKIDQNSWKVIKVQENLQAAYHGIKQGDTLLYVNDIQLNKATSNENARVKKILQLESAATFIFKYSQKHDQPTETYREYADNQRVQCQFRISDTSKSLLYFNKYYDATIIGYNSDFNTYDIKWISGEPRDTTNHHQNEIFDPDRLYHIEKIVAESEDKYLIQWKNSPDYKQTWEPKENIPKIAIDEYNAKVQSSLGVENTRKTVRSAEFQDDSSLVEKNKKRKKRDEDE